VIRDFFEKRRIRKSMSKYLSPEVMDKVLNASQSDMFKLREGLIDFVCVAVRGETPQVVSQRMGLVADLAVLHRATVYDLVSGIVIGAYGLLADEGDPVQNRLNFWASLSTDLKGDVKMVHGTTAGHFGNIGGKDRISFSFIAPGFLDALAVLAALPFGEACEHENK